MSTAWDTYVEDLRDMAGRIAYKPNWVVDVVPDEIGKVWLTMKFRTVDANHPGEDVPVLIGRRRQFPPMVHSLWPNAPSFESYTFHWMHEQVKDLEKHECDEWFRVDGERLVAPRGHAHGTS